MILSFRYKQPRLESKLRVHLALLLVTFFIAFSAALAATPENAVELSPRETIKKLLSDGEIREGYKLARKNRRWNKNAFWNEQLAIFAIHRGRIDRRDIRAAKSCVIDSKDKGHALATLAMVLALSGQSDSASQIAHEASKLQKENARALIALAYSKKQKGQLKEASELVANAVAFGSGNEDVMFLATKFYEENGNGKDVINAFDLWIKNSPNCAYAYYLKGKYLYNSLALSMALKEFRKAISLNPDYWNAEKECAYILTYQKKYKEAVGIFKSILARRKGYAVTYLHYAECLAALGEKKEAIANYNKALYEICDVYSRAEQLKSLPELNMIHQKWAVKAALSRAKLFMEVGELEQALSDARQISNYFPMRMEPRYIKMLVLMKMQNYQQALKEADILIDANEDISLFYLKRSEIHRGLKQIDAANKDVELANRLERTGSIHDAGE